MQKEPSRRLPSLIKDKAPISQHFETVAWRAFANETGEAFRGAVGTDHRPEYQKSPQVRTKGKQAKEPFKVMFDHFPKLASIGVLISQHRRGEAIGNVEVRGRTFFKGHT